MKRYHPILVILHWALAIMIIGGLIMGGFVLSETPNSDPFKMTALTAHMSMGMLILVLMIVRLMFRLFTKKPQAADIGNAMLNKSADMAHWAFYAVVIAMCASGIAIANAAGLPAIIFGGSGEPLPANFNDIPPRMAHGVIAKILGLLILSHVAAALYHQFVRKDGLLGRMWFGNRKG